MTRLFRLRLMLDLLAGGLILLGLAYWWLGNTVHELAGTGLFLLVLTHNLFNRRWYGHLSGSGMTLGRGISIALTLALAAAMLTLLVTSALISHALAGLMWPFSSFLIRQIHVSAAYWVLVLVSIHLGLRWSMLMGFAGTACRLSGPSRARRIVLRLAALAIALTGVWSATTLNLRARLSMETTLDWWNFEESRGGFFLHCLAVAGLGISATHYAKAGLRLLGVSDRHRAGA